MAPILNSTVTDVTFVVPGSLSPASTSAFGVVFTDVDTANTSSLEFFGLGGSSLGKFFVPNTVGNETLSFLGVRFDGGEQVVRVRITAGDQPLTAIGCNDCVAMDDFLYAEPQSVAAPEPFTAGFVATGLAGCGCGGGVRDNDSVRRAVLLLIVLTAPVQAQQGQPDPYERHRALVELFKDPDRADLDAVRRALQSALVDPEDLMRSETPLPSGLPRARIPPALAERFQQQFAGDKDAAVRSWIVNYFGRGGQNHDPRTLAIARSVLLKALEDNETYAVQFAGSAMYEWRIPEALPLLVKQLAHPSPIARLGVASGLQGYGAAARPYLPQLEEALKREPEGSTKKTLEAAIARIREGR
jgi:hypothetical protein